MTDKKHDENQGEGNVEADKRYRKATREFVEDADLEEKDDSKEGEDSPSKDA